VRGNWPRECNCGHHLERLMLANGGLLRLAVVMADPTPSLTCFRMALDQPANGNKMIGDTQRDWATIALKIKVRHRGKGSEKHPL